MQTPDPTPSSPAARPILFDDLASGCTHSVAVAAIATQLLVVGCLLLSAFFSEQSSACYRAVGQRLGTGASNAHVSEWVDQHLTPGIDRNRFEALLSTHVPISVDERGTEHNVTYVRLELRACAWPARNPTIFASFDQDGLLLDAHLESVD